LGGTCEEGEICVPQKENEYEILVEKDQLEKLE
jgi:hypothetical protein